MAKKKASKKPVTRITLRNVLSWVIGVFFLVAGVGMIGQGYYIHGLLIVILSAMIIPYFNKLTTKNFNFEISGGIKFVLIIIILVIAGFAGSTQYQGAYLAGNSDTLILQDDDTEFTTCVEDWSCSDWTDCKSNGKQTRSCTDANNCGTTKNKPGISQNCEYYEPQIAIDLDVMSVNAYWSDWLETGSISSVKVSIDNFGDITINPEYDVRIRYNNLVEFFDEDSIYSFVEVPPGKTKTDIIYLNADIEEYGSGLYTVYVDLKDEGSEIILASVEKKVTL